MSAAAPSSDGERGVGLDLALRKSGVFEGLGDKLLGGQIVKGDDAITMSRAVKAVLDGTRPDYVCIEGTFLGKNAQTLEDLVLLRGIIIGWCDDRKVRYYVGKTAEIDVRCGIQPFLKRPQRKKAIRRFAKLLGFDLPQDVADALAVLFWGMGERTRDRMLDGTWGMDA